MKIIHNSLIKWGQSDVYQSDDNCIRRYVRVKKEYALIYLKFHQKLNDTVEKIRLNKPINLWSFEIQALSIRFASVIDSIINIDWEVESKSEFIEWETLYDFYLKSNSENDYNSIMEILEIINSFIEKEWWINMDESFYRYQLHELNIKIRGYNSSKWEIELVITDIANNIAEFIEKNRVIKENN